jgi:alkane 1-monooxygenase
MYLYEQIGIIFSLAILLATNGINVAHELGHRKSLIEKVFSKTLLMFSLYMHFFIEHNLGHHKNVGTSLDPASAKLNQNLYHFWFTSTIGQYKMPGKSN